MNDKSLAKYGLNQYYQPVNSPVTTPSPIIGALFDMQNEIQGRFARLSNINIKNFVLSSALGTAYGTFGNNQSLNLSTNLTPQPPHQNDFNYAIPYISIYLGSFVGTFPGTAQIYPANGNSITPGNFKTQGDMNWHTYTGTNSTWSGLIINNSGATGTITFITQWKYLQYNAGTQT